MGSGSDVMGPLTTALGIGLTASGSPQAGLPLLGGGINQIAQPGGELGKILGNNPLMAGAGQMGAKMMQPPQPPQMPQQRPAPPPMPGKLQGMMPQASSAMAPPLQAPPIAQAGGMQLTPQQIAMLMQRFGQGGGGVGGAMMG